MLPGFVAGVGRGRLLMPQEGKQAEGLTRPKPSEAGT